MTKHNVKKNDMFDKAILDAHDNLMEKYGFSKEGLAVIAPKTVQEIVNEGHTLHHCVHFYAERVVEGECIILFIRKADNIDEPFYTVEIRDNRVIQIRGKYNCGPTDEMKHFLSLWEGRKIKKAV